MVIPAKATQAFRTRFRGALLQPGEEGYDEARRVWNGAIDRRPALIARCAGSDDVVEAVRFAREQDLRVAVRCGGHSVAGHGVCDDGLMIDLSLMKRIEVDPAASTARAAGGALLGDLDRATQQFKLATTAGIVSHTGVGGLTLGGGVGHLVRKHGLTIDNLLGVDLVTADAERVRADENTNPELFWGLRGGGGNFGIATAFEYRLHPVGPLVLAGPIFWPVDAAPAVLRAVNQYAPEAPDELGIAMTVRPAPPAPFLPASEYGKPVVGLLLLWTGDPEKADAALAPLRAVPNPLADVVRPIPYLMYQSSLDGGNPHGAHYYWRSQRVGRLSDSVIDALVDLATSSPTPQSYIGGLAVGGAVTRVDADATAIGEREIGYELNIVAEWPPSDGRGESHASWVRRGWDALAPERTGVFSHFLTDEGPAGVREAFGDRLKRLTVLKDRYDPTNVFRMNANVEPTGGGR